MVKNNNNLTAWYVFYASQFWRDAVKVWNWRTSKGSTWALRCLFPRMRSSPLTLPWREDPLRYSCPEFLTMSKINRSDHSTHKQLLQMPLITLVKNDVLFMWWFQVQLMQGSLMIPSPPKRTKSSSRGCPVTVSALSYTLSPPLFNSVDEVIRAKIHSPPDIVQTIRNNPHLGFLYVTSTAPKSSIKFDTYNLK